MPILLLIFLLLCTEICSAKTYNGAKVYEVTPENSEHQRILDIFHSTADFDFWSDSRRLHHSTRIMVHPSIVNSFENITKAKNMKCREIITDVGSFLDNIYPKESSHVISNGSIQLNKFNSYKVIRAYLTHLQIWDPYKIDVSKIGKTAEGRDILVVKISEGIERPNKPAILIDAGIHAREWIGPATALYLIDRLTKCCDSVRMLTSVDWYIIPLLNPDGYEYSQTKDRLWRKNRSKGKLCYGVDPNRNFNFHWMQGGSSTDECSEIYAGKKPFSERESIALRDFIKEKQHQIKLYITLHSFGKYIVYPWNYSPVPPDNVKALHELALKVSEAIEAVFGTKYVCGTSNEIMHPASGNTEDWVKGAGGIQFAFAIELPGGGETGFDVPENMIQTVGTEIFAGIKVFWQFVAKNWGNIQLFDNKLKYNCYYF